MWIPWDDATTITEWMDRATVNEATFNRVETLGWCVYEDDECIKVALSIDTFGERASDMIVIPNSITNRVVFLDPSFRNEKKVLTKRKK